jgi:hypothetical protein
LVQIFQIIIAVSTILVGFVSMVRPSLVVGFTGLEPMGGRGVSEIRSIFGGAFLGLGIAPLVLNTPAAYQTLGITYLTIGVIRAASILIDRSPTSSNLISLLVEIVFGLILLF